MLKVVNQQSVNHPQFGPVSFTLSSFNGRESLMVGF